MSDNKIQWQNILTGGIGTALSTGMGMLLQGQQDKRQLRQQEKLQNLQIKGTKELTDYNYLKELEMWKNTSYGAQREQMESAGINPALMYGMGGGGGQTIGTGGGSQVSGGNAPVGGREIQDAIGMGLQMQMMKAQKENIEADTELKKENKENVSQDTQVKIADVGRVYALSDKITQEVNIMKSTLDDQIQKIKGESESAWAKGKIDVETVNEEISRVVNESLQSALKNANIEADTAKKIADVTQEWVSLDLEERKTKVLELTGGDQKDQDQLINLINSIVHIVGGGLLARGMKINKSSIKPGIKPVDYQQKLSNNFKQNQYYKPRPKQ